MIRRRAEYVELSPSMQAVLAFGTKRAVRTLLLRRGRDSFVLGDGEVRNLMLALNAKEDVDAPE